MDAEYLKATVGAVLTAGLTEMVLKRPEDPVDYLASFLRNAVEDKVARIERKPATQSHTHTQPATAAVPTVTLPLGAERAGMI